MGACANVLNAFLFNTIQRFKSSRAFRVTFGFEINKILGLIRAWYMPRVLGTVKT